MHPLIRATLALLGSASLAPGAIVLTNASFETPNINPGAAQLNGITGWTTGAVYLVDNTGNPYFSDNVPSGDQAMSLAGSYATQQLNDGVNPVMTLPTSQQFDISFFAGRRLGASGAGSATFSVILQAYNGATYVGDLASQMFFLGANDSNSNTIDLNLLAGEWSDQINLSLTAPANLFVNSNIRLVFAQNAPYGSGTGFNEAAIDDVSVTLVPEPSIALLGGLGLLGLLRRRR